MALISFQQTNTAADYSAGTYCPGIGNAPTAASLTMASSGGTAGTNTTTATLAASTSFVYGAFIKCTVPSNTTWAAGTWTWRLTVSTANMNLTIVRVYICRVNSSNVSQATIADTGTISVNLGTTGTVTGTVTGTAQIASAGDNVIIIFWLTNGAMSTQSVGLTSSAIVDSPFTTIDRTPRPTSIGHPFIF